MRSLIAAISLLALLATTPWLAADEAPGSVIFDMDSMVFKPGEFTKDNQKHSAGTAELMDGKFGKAMRFSFVEGASGGFMSARIHPTNDWNKADGFSFWVKGDGSASWAGLELIDRDDYSLRYAYCFPIDSTDWRKVVVPWRDLIPELAGPPITARDGFSPSQFGAFSFGKWFFWRDYPAHSYAIDQITLEPKIEASPLPPFEPGLKRLRNKLRAHQPITIVTMGDSLTDQHHWSNREVVWHQLLARALHNEYGSDVKIINPAIGGTTLSQNAILMPRWSKEAAAPDLVTIWFGGNDWESGVRGPRFAEYLRLTVDRIRRQTHGSADILLMTPCPSHDHWETYKDLEQAVRDVAKEKQTGVADVAAEFHKEASADEALRKSDWAWDKVHLGQRGHEIARDSVLRAIRSDQ